MVFAPSPPRSVLANLRPVNPQKTTLTRYLPGQEIRFDDWGIDVVVGASQKGLSTPPGLSITVVSQKALKVLADRKTPVASYFASYNRWLPIMKSYEAGTPAYFATPPVVRLFTPPSPFARLGDPDLWTVPLRT